MDGEVGERLDGLDDETKRYILYVCGDFVPKIGTEEIPRGRGDQIHSGLTQVENFIPVHGYPHPKYKGLVFESFRSSGDQRWKLGEWIGAKRINGAGMDELSNVGLKLCPKCSNLKLAGDFSESRKRRDGLASKCKSCAAVAAKTDKAKATAKRCGKIYRKDNREKCLEASKKWARDNPERANGHTKKCRENNPEKYCKWNKTQNEKRRSTQAGLLHDRFASSLTRAIRNFDLDKKGGRSIEYLGCSFQEFGKKYIENKPDGVSFEEFRKGVDIDHIIPVSVSIEIEERKLLDKKGLHRLVFALWHYSNLQALDWIENQFIKKDFVNGKRAKDSSDEELIEIAEKLIESTEAIRKTDTKKPRHF